jgi:hypothetical protein
MLQLIRKIIKYVNMEKPNQEQPRMSRRSFIKGLAADAALLNIGIWGGKYVGESTKENLAEESIESIVNDLNAMLSSINENTDRSLKSEMHFSAENVQILFSADGKPYVVVSYDSEALFQGPYNDRDLYENMAESLVDFLYDNQMFEVKD